MPITSQTCFLSPFFFHSLLLLFGLVPSLHHHSHLPRNKLVQSHCGSWEHFFHIFIMTSFCVHRFFFFFFFKVVVINIHQYGCMHAPCQSNSTVWVNADDRFPMRQHCIKEMFAFLELDVYWRSVVTERLNPDLSGPKSCLLTWISWDFRVHKQTIICF